MIRSLSTTPIVCRLDEVSATKSSVTWNAAVTLNDFFRQPSKLPSHR